MSLQNMPKKGANGKTQLGFLVLGLVPSFSDKLQILHKCYVIQDSCDWI
jgi:hypothetical protein